MNLCQLPNATYHYDELTPWETDELLDQIKLFNGLKKNIIYQEFMRDVSLSKFFAPIATYDKEGEPINQEFVAMIEGVKDPFFGIAYSID